MREKELQIQIIACESCIEFDVPSNRARALR
jgi:hypothetical protein